MAATKSRSAAYWICTLLFALWMGITAYAHLRIPAAAQVFPNLGFPDYFRIELSLAKLIGIVVLVVPMVPARLKEWAYAGFTIVLISALIAHFAVGDDASKWSWAAGTLVLEALSYYFYRKSEPASRESTLRAVSAAGG
jgi:hypothetical protein